MPETTYDEELEEDLQTIRKIVEEMVALEATRRLYAQNATRAFAGLTSEQLSELNELGKESFEVAKEMARANQEPYFSIIDFASFPAKLEEILTTQLSEDAYADLQDWRVDLIEGLGEVEALKMQLLHPEMKSPYELLSFLYDSFKEQMTPEQQAARRKQLKFVAKHEDDIPVDDTGYWEGVASLVYVLSIVSIFLMIILKWVNYALDDYEDYRVKDWRGSWRKRLRKIGEVIEPLSNVISRILELIFRLPAS
ncbi:MAG: hypothetical protein V3U52_02525 [Thermoplasmata archaeon]